MQTTLKACNNNLDKKTAILCSFVVDHCKVNGKAAMKQFFHAYE